MVSVLQQTERKTVPRETPIHKTHWKGSSLRGWSPWSHDYTLIISSSMYVAQTLSQIKTKFLKLMPIPKLYTLNMNAGCSVFFFFKLDIFSTLVHSQNNPSFIEFNIAVMAYCCQVKASPQVYSATNFTLCGCICCTTEDTSRGLPRFPWWWKDGLEKWVILKANQSYQANSNKDSHNSVWGEVGKKDWKAKDYLCRYLNKQNGKSNWDDNWLDKVTDSTELSKHCLVLLLK